MQGYSVTIVEASRELSAKERVQLKDTTEAIKLDEATQQGNVIIDVDFYAVLQIHNEKSSNKDYYVYLVQDKNGARYVTGSESFFTSFRDIVDEMCDAECDDWGIKVYRMPSKNYNGKEFITCSII